MFGVLMRWYAFWAYFFGTGGEIHVHPDPWTDQ
jgi:hypothetical protein